MVLQRLRIADLCLDFQDSECLIPETVAGYVQDFTVGRSVAPVNVCFDGRDYILFDGFHRVTAATQFGLEVIEAEVEAGTRAQLDSRWREGLNRVKRELSEWAKANAVPKP
jgi:hypothetical protein